MANSAEYINYRYRFGTKVLVELVEGDTYEGQFHHTTDSGVFLKNVVEYPIAAKRKTILLFYKIEIVSITVIEENPDNSSQISKQLFDESKFLARNFEYLSLPTLKYSFAINELKSSAEIAIWGFGSFEGRTEKILVFGVATHKKSYLFDMRRIHPTCAFALGLQELLENRNILKIVHDSKTLTDCLCHQHQVRMENVFDTQVADFMLVQKETNETPKDMLKLSDCIYKYLKVPKCVLLDTEVGIYFRLR